MIKVIRRERTKPLPAGAIYVGRGSRWGNPYRIDGDYVGGAATDADPRLQVIALYRAHIANHPALVEQLAAKVAAVRAEGTEPSLACWCAPRPCHADVLAELVEVL